MNQEMLNLPRFRIGKMNKTRLLFLMMVLLFALSQDASAEGDRTSANHSPTEDFYTQVSITYSEENSQYGFKKEVFHTETAHAHYYFESVLDENLRQTCMETTDSIIAHLGIASVKPEIYIFSDETFHGINIIGNALYTCQSSWKSVDYAANVILAVYGECCHYGLAYGYVAILCEPFGWEIPETTNGCIPENTDVYDLNLLCFDRDFVSEGDVLAAQQIACQFAKELIETCGEETVRHLLAASQTDDGMAALSEKLGAYYRTQKIDYTPSLLRLGYGGISYDYILKSEFGTFYVGTDWTDANRAFNPLVTENFLHGDYPTAKAFFECNLDQMKRYQALFDLGDDDHSLKITFPNSRAGAQYSYYQAEHHRIIVFNVDSLMHEYIHALTKPKASQSLWETEGFARYFSYYYDDYGIAFLNEDYNTATESKATEYLFEFKRTIQRPVDLRIDFKELENIAVYSRNYTDPDASYIAGSSFIQYLVRTYGEAFVVQCIYGDAHFPKQYRELVDEWNQYIEENYSNFSRYQR